MKNSKIKNYSIYSLNNNKNNNLDEFKNLKEYYIIDEFKNIKLKEFKKMNKNYSFKKFKEYYNLEFKNNFKEFKEKELLKYNNLDEKEKELNLFLEYINNLYLLKELDFKIKNFSFKSLDEFKKEKEKELKIFDIEKKNFLKESKKEFNLKEKNIKKNKFLDEKEKEKNFKELNILKDEKEKEYLKELELKIEKEKEKILKELKEKENFLLKILLNYRIKIRELKEKEKELKNNLLNNKYFSILNIENYIFNLNKKDFKDFSDKKYLWIKTLWKELDLNNKVDIEKVLNYFIFLIVENQKEKYLNFDFIDKKIKLEFSKKELKSLDELNSFSFKELKSNYLENFNNKYIINYIKELENLIWKDIIEELNNNLYEKEKEKELYKLNILLLKENLNNKKEYEKEKEKYFKDFHKNLSKIDMNIKRKTFKLKGKYNFLYDIENQKEKELKLKKQLKEKEKELEKENLNNNKFNYKEYLNTKKIKYLKYLNNNLDIDIEKEKNFKKYFKVFKEYKLK